MKTKLLIIGIFLIFPFWVKSQISVKVDYSATSQSGSPMLTFHFDNITTEDVYINGQAFSQYDAKSRIDLTYLDSNKKVIYEETNHIFWPLEKGALTKIKAKTRKSRDYKIIFAMQNIKTININMYMTIITPNEMKTYKEKIVLEIK